MSKTIAIIISLFLAPLVLAACGPTASDGAGASRTRTVTIAPGAELVRGGCIDTTASVGGSFGADVRDRIAESVGSRIPPRPADWSKGVDAIPGLVLELRLVTTRPLAQHTPHVRIEVPAVRGLAPMPDLSDSSVLDAPSPGAESPYEVWRDHRVAWQTAYGKALARQSAAAHRIRALSLHGGRSGITGCMSSLAQDLRGHGAARYLLASDLQENVSAELSGSLDHSPVVVIQPCPSGIAQTCDGDFKAMSEQLKRLQASQIIRETEASANQGVTAWLKAG